MVAERQASNGEKNAAFLAFKARIDLEFPAGTRAEQMQVAKYGVNFNMIIISIVR